MFSYILDLEICQAVTLNRINSIGIDTAILTTVQYFWFYVKNITIFRYNTVLV